MHAIRTWDVSAHSLRVERAFTITGTRAPEHEHRDTSTIKKQNKNMGKTPRRTQTRTRARTGARTTTTRTSTRRRERARTRTRSQRISGALQRYLHIFLRPPGGLAVDPPPRVVTHRERVAVVHMSFVSVPVATSDRTKKTIMLTHSRTGNDTQVLELWVM